VWESNPPSAGLRRLTGFEALLGLFVDAAWLLRLRDVEEDARQSGEMFACASVRE
jgi:hypothetical protein